MAFPRTKVVPARPARETVGATARVAERRAEVRSSVELMVIVIDGCDSIEGIKHFKVVSFECKNSGRGCCIILAVSSFARAELPNTTDQSLYGVPTAAVDPTLTVMACPTQDKDYRGEDNVQHTNM